MRAYLMAGLAVALMTPQMASAQTDVSFRGLRLEGDVGWNRFRAEDDNNSKLGYGGTVGADSVIDQKIVIGVEGSYWRPDDRNISCRPLNGGASCQQSRRELGAALRVGYLITPALLLFGKGGYVSDSQRNSFQSSSGLYYDNGSIVGPGYSARDRYFVDGYQAGGGVEYSLTRLFYIGGQFIYSRYENHTSTERALFGAGIRFR